MNIGWRNSKFNYEVEYEVRDFKGEKEIVREKNKNK